MSFEEVIERAPAYQAEEPDGETGVTRFPIRVNPEFAHIQLGSIQHPQPNQYYRWGLWYFTSTASWYL